jgi:hypothetical protein
MSSATQERNRVASLSASQPQKALEVANAVTDPWFRCQALSIAAVHLTDRPAQGRAIDDAFASANKLREPNRVVTVSSWPIKALALTGNITRVPHEVARLLAVMSTEPSPVRRADALRYLLGSVSASTTAVARRVAAEFAAACLAPLRSGKRNAKGESQLEECLPGIAQIDRDLADSLILRLPATRSARAARAIQASQQLPITTLLAWPNFDAA